LSIFGVGLSIDRLYPYQLSAKSHLADHFAKARFSFPNRFGTPMEFTMTTKQTPKETRLLEILIAILRRAGGKPK
jgi:hypothetical protein